MQKHIILIGFMGVGKSTVGNSLSKILGISHLDTDEEIMKEENRTITDIFKTHGEGYFRQKEHELLIKCTNEIKQHVISTGGGMVLKEENREILKEHIVIYLYASPEIIYKRVKRNTERPLLQSEQEMWERIQTLYEQRKATYEQLATYHISTQDKSIDIITKEILHILT